VTHNASGRFELTLTPASGNVAAEDAGVTRYLLEKQYRGDLEGTGVGEMLTLDTASEDSGAYVAIERIDARLDGRSGTFALQHSGTVERGFERLTITVVPDSGTGELEGIQGRISITIFNDEHLYELEYSLPD